MTSAPCLSSAPCWHLVCQNCWSFSTTLTEIRGFENDEREIQICDRSALIDNINEALTGLRCDGCQSLDN